MITKQLTGRGEMYQLFAAVAAYTMNLCNHHHYHGFLLLSIVLVQKPLDLLNIAFLLLKQFANTNKYYLQLLKEKAEIVASILFDFKCSKCMIEL